MRKLAIIVICLFALFTIISAYTGELDRTPTLVRPPSAPPALGSAEGP